MKCHGVYSGGVGEVGSDVIVSSIKYGRLSGKLSESDSDSIEVV